MGKTYISPEITIIKMENNLMRDFASKANTNNAADDSGNITEGPGIGEGEALMNLNIIPLIFGNKVKTD